VVVAAPPLRAARLCVQLWWGLTRHGILGFLEP
jgi:hypothetical protein